MLTPYSRVGIVGSLWWAVGMGNFVHEWHGRKTWMEMVKCFRFNGYALEYNG